jgi:hypothetical protein
MAEDTRIPTNAGPDPPIPNVETPTLGTAPDTQTHTSITGKAGSKTPPNDVSANTDITEKLVKDVDTVDTAEDTDDVAGATPDYYLTGTKLALAHTGFLL